MEWSNKWFTNLNRLNSFGGTLGLKIDGSAHDDKSSFKILGLLFNPNLESSALLKLPLRKLKFLDSKVPFS